MPNGSIFTGDKHDDRRPQQPSHTSLVSSGWAAGGLIVALVLAAVLKALSDASHGRRALAFLTHPLEVLASLGQQLEIHAVSSLSASAIGFVGILFIGALVAGLRRAAASSQLSLLAIVALGCVALPFLPIWFGTTLIVAGLTTTVLFRSPSSISITPSTSSMQQKKLLSLNQAWSFYDTVWCCGLVALAAVFRFFALNQIMPIFEGELSPYMIGASDLRGMIYANEGVNGPWAPLGLLYYLPIWLMIQLDGHSLLAVRLGSALPSVITVALVYVVGRAVAGRPGAIVAAGLLALDNLQIGWGRTDVHPHGSTSWITLLIVLATIRALSAPLSKRAWWILAPLMGLAWHQYPSGQVAVAIPVLAAAFALLRAGANRTDLRGMISLVAGPIVTGVVLWMVGPVVVHYLATGEARPPSYLDLLGPRVYLNQLPESASLLSMVSALIAKSSGHLMDLLLGVFVKAPYLFHQDILIPLGDLPIRTVSLFGSVLILFGVLALIRSPRREVVFVLAAAVVVATLSATLSERAYPKRASNLYPLLAIIGGIGFQYWAAIWSSAFYRLFRLVPYLAASGAVCLQLCLMSWAWFGGRHIPYIRPFEERLAQAIRMELTPGSIGIAWTANHYFEGKLGYLLLDHLLDQRNFPVLWLSDEQARHRVASEPLSETDTKMLIRKYPFLYLWSPLRDAVPALAEAAYSKLVVVVQREGAGVNQVERYRSRYPSLKEIQFDDPMNHENKFSILVGDLNGGGGLE